MTSSSSVPQARDRVRLYQSLRSAHLERAHELPRARIIYAERRYDFDESLVGGLDLYDGGRLRAARALFRQPPRILEVNEPLMLESALWTLAAVYAVRLRTLGKHRVRIVTYAIENLDPRPIVPGQAWRSRVRHRMELRAARALAAQIDRIAYGTAAAQKLYRDFGVPHAAETLIWALPRPIPGDSAAPPVALFASAFSARKGIDTLLDAWPAVVRDLPEARLVLVGKGAEQARVEAAAASELSVTVLIDPPRAEVRRQFSRCRVVVLPSRPTSTWREQVGLPIVEGLSRGRTIVTTGETGLAQWLLAHGHRVIEPGDPATLADALVQALRDPIEVAKVCATLPEVDGRLAADAWMFGADE